MSDQSHQLDFNDINNFDSVNTETLTLLKILAIGSKQIEENKVQRPEDVFKRIRENGSITF